MKNNLASDIKVGVVSIVAIVVLIGGILLGKGVGLNSAIMVKMRFPNSGSIQLTSPVLINGVKRGAVTDVRNDRGGVLITAEIDNIDDIFSDASAKISILEITGGKKIEIYPGKSGSKFNPSDEIPGTTPADLADLVAVAGGLVDNLGELIVDADTAITSVNAILADGTVNTRLRNILENTDNMTKKLSTFVDNNIAELDKTVKNANYIIAEIKKSVQKNEPKVSKLVDELDLTMQKTNKLLGNIDNTVNDANSLIIDLSKVSAQINSGEGAVGKFIYDKKFANSLDSTINELTEFVKQLKKYGINANIRLGSRP